MPQEIEAKFYVVRPDNVKREAERQGACLIQPRTYERNLRFDTPARELSRERRVLRLRRDAGAHLTYKGAGRVQSGTVSRTELEVELDDFDTAQQLLESLGYEVVFIYEKYRATYKLDKHEIMFDELPYGEFIEIEGAEAGMERVARNLGLSWQAAISESYSALFERLRARLHLSFRDLTFENLAQLQVSAEQLGVVPAD